MTHARLPRHTRSAAAKNSATVAAWTLVSRVTGLVRVLVIGMVLGPTYFANSFLASNSVPNIVYLAIAGPVLGMVVVPAVVRIIVDLGVERAADLLRRLTGFLLTCAGMVAALLVVVSPVVAWALTFGIPQEDTQARAFRLTILILVFVAPQVVLYTLAALGAAVQQARGRFAMAAAAPALENVGLMVTMAVVAVLFEPGLEVEAIPLGLVIILGLGSTLAVALHAALQLVGAARVSLPVRPALGWRTDPPVVEAALRVRQSVAVAAAPASAYFVLLAVAATVPGGVLVLQVAYAIYSVPTALGARAVSSAVLPGLSEAAKRDDRSGYASAWRDALFYVTVVGLPSLCLLAVLAHPIAEILANGRLRSGPLITSLAVCIAILATAQLAAGIRESGQQALFARIELRGPRLASVMGLVVSLTAALGSLLLPTGTARLAGLSLAVLAADVVAAVIVVSCLRAAIRPEPVADGRQLSAVAAATALMLPAVVAGWWLAHNAVGNQLAQLTMLVASGGVGLAIFASVLRIAAPRGIWRAS